MSHIDFPRAIFAKTPSDASSILGKTPSYQKIVNECLIDVPDTMFHMCQCAAAEVYQTGMLAMAHDAVLNIVEEWKGNSKARRKIQVKVLKSQRGKVVNQLQSVGILPTGLGWFLVKWFVLPFLLELLKRWSIGPDDDLQDQ
jgi:hypothetical protein